MNQRRTFLRSLSSIAIVSASGIPLSAFALEKVNPKDPQAVSLGYTDNTKTVDDKKYPKHQASQSCSGCQFFQAAQQSGDIAPCTVFGGKGVAANGWCSAYVKKQG